MLQSPTTACELEVRNGHFTVASVSLPTFWYHVTGSSGPYLVRESCSHNLWLFKGSRTGQIRRARYFHVGMCEGSISIVSCMASLMQLRILNSACWTLKCLPSKAGRDVKCDGKGDTMATDVVSVSARHLATSCSSTVCASILCDASLIILGYIVACRVASFACMNVDL